VLDGLVIVQSSLAMEHQRDSRQTFYPSQTGQSKSNKMRASKSKAPDSETTAFPGPANLTLESEAWLSGSVSPKVPPFPLVPNLAFSRVEQPVATTRSRFIPHPVYARDGAASPQRIASLPFPKMVTEHFVGVGSSIQDPEIRLQKCTRPAGVRIKTHHPRTPDVGIGILIFMPNYRAGAEPPQITEYYGEYLGHGQSKTAFELNHSGALFHGKVLKVAQANDMEPSVFIEASKIGLTTSILYNCAGIDVHSGRRFHCWITDRTIPLDDFCRDDDAIKDRCSLAAFCCILRAALHGLYLSDCHFFNFGVQLNESATEHVVVIIDAGSRGIHRDAKWKKSEINTKIMHKFWKACAKEAATNADLKNLWMYGNADSIATCLKIASEAWQTSPFLTKSQASSCAMWQAMTAKDSFRRTVDHKFPLRDMHFQTQC
jgi:hypothetical protein